LLRSPDYLDTYGSGAKIAERVGGHQSSQIPVESFTAARGSAPAAVKPRSTKDAFKGVFCVFKRFVHFDF